MRAKQFIPEAAIGTNPKRPAREGSRPARGHNTEPRYKEQDVAEMDSQGYTGTRDDYEQDSKHKGPEGKGTPVTAKQMISDLEKELNDKFNTPAQLKKDADYRAYRKGVKASRKQSIAERLDSDRRAHLDSLIDAYRNATDPEAYYSSDDDYDNPDDIIAQIRSEFGDKIADTVEGGTMHFPRPGHAWQQNDPMDPMFDKSPRVTKSGKVNRQDVNVLKKNIQRRVGDHTRPNLPEQGVAEETREAELNRKFNSPEQLKKDADYRAYRAGVKASRKQPPASLPEAGMGMWGDKGHNAKSQATKDLERSRNEKKQAAERNRAEERDRAWWKAQDDATKAGKDTFEFDGKTHPVKEQGVAEGIVDTIRSKNYARLADRSADKRATALDNFDEPEHQKQTDIMKQRNLKSKLLNKKGVAEDVSRLSDEEYNRVAAYVRKKYPGTQLSGLGRNPDGSFNVMIDTGSGRHEFKVRFREPEETKLDELSPQTLRSYLKKSKGHSQKYDQLGNKADEKGDEELANKMWNKGDNRYAGAEQARAKLAGIDEQIARMEAELAEHGKASRELCKSSKPDADLGASMLASCKSQGLRARDGDKSHKLGKTAKSRVKVGGHRIKGQKYGGPLPDWS